MEVVSTHKAITYCLYFSTFLVTLQNMECNSGYLHCSERRCYIHQKCTFYTRQSHFPEQLCQLLWQENFKSKIFTIVLGGAVYLYSGYFTLFENSDTVDFLNNAAGDTGGAVSLLNSDMMVRKMSPEHSNLYSKEFSLIPKTKPIMEELFMSKSRIFELSTFLFVALLT